jgi:hypothetical protein
MISAARIAFNFWEAKARRSDTQSSPIRPAAGEHCQARQITRVRLHRILVFAKLGPKLFYTGIPTLSHHRHDEIPIQLSAYA